MPIPVALPNSAARRLARCAVVVASLLAAVPAAPAADDVPAALVHELAPTGRLRVAINYGNPVLAQKDPVDPERGPPHGVSADLARELGRRLGLPVDFLPFDSAGATFEALKQGRWDVGFLAIDPHRAEHIAFGPPYVLIEGTYLVAADSPLKDIEDVDRPGIRIAVGLGSAYDLYLGRNLKQAVRVQAPTSMAAVDLYLHDRLDAVAGVRQPLEAYARSHAGYRVLPGRFMSIDQALATPKERTDAARWLRGFIEEMKASGFVARALAASGQTAATVAPPAP